MVEINVSDLLSLNSPNIIDIRSIEKYNDNHIPGSIYIDSNSLISNPSNYLDKNRNYYIYCQKGKTSKKVVEILRTYGYSVYNVIGGYESYILM